MNYRLVYRPRRESGVGGLLLQEIEQPLLFRQELGPVRRVDRRAVAGAEAAPRIDRGPGDAQLIVQVRTGGEAARADEADGLALLDVRALVDARPETGEMPVAGGGGPVVPDLDQVAVAAHARGINDRALPDRAHRRAVRGAEIDAEVGPAVMQNGVVAAPAEARRDAPEFERRAQQLPPHRVALLVVELLRAVGAVVPEGI